MPESSLRPAEASDSRQIWEWRNRAAVREMSFQHQPITWEDHSGWFATLSNRPDRRLYVYGDAGRDLGIVQFNGLQGDQPHAFWSFYIGAEDAPSGSGTRMLQAALHLAFSELALPKLSGEVLEFNTASLHLHRKLGFREEGCFRQHYWRDGRYYAIYRFGFLKDEYAH